MKDSHWLSLSGALLVLSGFFIPAASGSSILYENDPPNGNLNTGSAQSDVGVVQTGDEPNYCASGTCGTPGTGPEQPFILGDQFALSSNSTITSVTVYEVDDRATAGPTSAAPSGDTLGAEFSHIFLAIGPDGTPLTAAAGAPSSILEYYLPDGEDYDSISSPGVYYAMWAITFSGLDITLPAGDYDFAVGAVSIGSDTFALLASDGGAAGNPIACTSPCVSDTPGFGYQDYQHDPSPSGPPILTYTGNSVGYTGGNNLDLAATISGAAVPEPASAGLVALGLGGMLLGIRRVRAKRART